MQRIENNRNQDKLLIISLLIKGDYQDMLNALKSCLVMGMKVDDEFSIDINDFIRLARDYQRYADNTLTDSDVWAMVNKFYPSSAEAFISLNSLVNLFDNLSLFDAYYRVAVNQVEEIQSLMNEDKNPAPSAPPYHLVYEVIDQLSVVPSAPPEDDNIRYTGMTSSILFPHSPAIRNVAEVETNIRPAIPDREIDTTLQICVVGDIATGKSVLVHSYINNEKPGNLTYGCTNFFSKYHEVLGKEWKVIFIDMSDGVQRLPAIKLPFYKKAQAFIVTLDITDKGSLQYAETRIKEILSYKENEVVAKDAFIILAITKCDLTDKRLVTSTEIASLLNKYDHSIAFHVETSVEKSIGVEHLFSTTIEWMVEEGLRNPIYISEEWKLESVEKKPGCVIA